MRAAIVLSLVSLLAACGGGEAECGTAECEAICAAALPPAPPAPPANALELNDFEHGLLEPLLSEMRQGVRPFGDDAIGICKGRKECEEFLGSEGKDLPAGEYMVRAELRVPDVGELGTWVVSFESKCTTFRQLADGSEEEKDRDYAREYKVRYTGEQRGYRLQPLRTIDSPGKTGRQECTYALKVPNADGEQVFEGSWSVPGPEAAP